MNSKSNKINLGANLPQQLQQEAARKQHEQEKAFNSYMLDKLTGKTLNDAIDNVSDLFVDKLKRYVFHVEISRYGITPKELINYHNEAKADLLISKIIIMDIMNAKPIDVINALRMTNEAYISFVGELIEYSDAINKFEQPIIEGFESKNSASTIKLN